MSSENTDENNDQRQSTPPPPAYNETFHPENQDNQNNTSPSTSDNNASSDNIQNHTSSSHRKKKRRTHLKRSMTYAGPSTVTMRGQPLPPYAYSDGTGNSSTVEPGNSESNDSNTSYDDNPRISHIRRSNSCSSIENDMNFYDDYYAPPFNTYYTDPEEDNKGKKRRTSRNYSKSYSEFDFILLHNIFIMKFFYVLYFVYIFSFVFPTINFIFIYLKLLIINIQSC